MSSRGSTGRSGSSAWFNLTPLLPGDKLDIKEGPQGLFIPGLRVEAVGGAEDVVAVLQKGKQHRSTFATNMNEHSSRSHLVLTIYVKGYDTAKGERAAARAECARWLPTACPCWCAEPRYCKTKWNQHRLWHS